MGRLSALAGFGFWIAMTLGCGDDTASEQPIDLNVKLAAVTKERDAAQAELKKARDAELSQLARFEAAETAAATGNDEFKRQLNTLNRQLADAQAELKKARKEAADLKKRRAESGAGAKEAVTAPAEEANSAANVPGGQHTHEQELAARDFRCDDVTFETTLPEFKKLYPNSTLTQPSQIGESSYQFNSKSVGTFVATFLDDRLLSVQLRYTDQQLAELGGWDTLKKHLQTQFGDPDIFNDHVMRWTFDPVDRIILASGRSGGAAVVTVSKKSTGEERNHRLDKLGAGI